ncbi:MAG: hypothetical protein M1822_004774 [Bathelium mastoideum]|nr:MAG: hypothetical protein M1822_004774 [Bathelium mastoideum]
MPSYTYGPINNAEEGTRNALHHERLMVPEEKPFRRITKRLLDSHSLVSPSASLPTPPPDTPTSETPSTASTIPSKAIEQWRQDTLLDFAAFEASIVRLQLLQHSNARERARYASEKQRIARTAAAVRANTTALRAELRDAQATLATRQGYDAAAERITGNRALRPRTEQAVALARLRGEIEGLEGESGAYARTWRERREQFGRIVEEGRQMLRLIRDEKEEAERKEGMMEGGGDEGDEGEGSERKGESRAGTPMLDGGGQTPRAEEGGATPMLEDGATPRLDVGAATPQSGYLSPMHKPLPGVRSRLGITSPAPSSSRLSSPGRQDQERLESERPDEKMGQVSDAELNETVLADTEMEEGEEAEEGEEKEDCEEPERGGGEVTRGVHGKGDPEEGLNEQVEAMDET